MPRARLLKTEDAVVGVKEDAFLKTWLTGTLYSRKYRCKRDSRE